MQMYKVTFHSRRGALVETGAFLVCAQNTESAEQSVGAVLGIPPASIEFETSRVKPSIYELHRSEYTEHKPAFLKAQDDNPGAVHEVRASAKVFAYSEPAAVRRLADALTKSVSVNKKEQPRHVNELNVEIARADQRPAPSRIEQQSIYRETRFFPGGAARPR
jgi:hypothetical protein